MCRSLFLLGCVLGLILSSSSSSSTAKGAIVEHTFNVQNLTVDRLCNKHVITAVNGSLPGPIINVREGDTLIVHVFNKSPYNFTIHWHGIFQKLSAWADGPDMVTQCPIQPGGSYTYRFKITKQEGTLWWHAHASWLRATVHGALIIRPRHGRPYPFPKPHKEVPILLGEWWNANVVDVDRQGTITGASYAPSDAFTINGRPGDLYNCSKNHTYKLKVEQGKRYLLRIINAALTTERFFKVANHKLTVVAVDASYTTPYLTDIVVLAPGQTTDVLLTADQPLGNYYMVVSPFWSTGTAVVHDNTTTRGVIHYDGAVSPSSKNTVMPLMPAANDTLTAFQFMSNLTGLAGGPFWVPVPRHVDESMFVTLGAGLAPCDNDNSSATCQGPFGNRLSANMNNRSFVFPTKMSMLEAFFRNSSGGVYTSDFPDNPPAGFDYTNASIAGNLSLMFSPKSTSVKRVRFNSTVQVVFQNTAVLAVDNHPMHLHGFNFHVLAQGFGNYDPVNDPKKFNLVNPQMRNTIGVPTDGWAAIRFTANNPGVWLVHCHLEQHLPWGLAMAFEVENGGTPESTLPPPPSDFPKCF